MIRKAELRDLAAIESLLANAKLPTSGIADHISGFVVSDAEGAVVGVAGLEIYGSVALVRSLAVAPSHRRHGLATRLCDQLEREANEKGVEQFYVLTETAASFFTGRGYTVISRDAAPPELAASALFRKTCPDTAVFMRRSA